jgi:DHA3 family macrolide efflux protein-like MFS transporter
MMSENETGQAENWKRPFFTIWLGQAASLLGSSMIGTALGWWLASRTGSGIIFSISMIFEMGPGIVLGPFAGALVDRWNRRAVMLVADAFIALMTLWLLYLFLVGQVQVWHIYAIMLLRSAAGTFHNPAMMASTALMVPEAHLTRVSGMNDALNGVINIFAPAAAAFLVEAFSIEAVLTIDIATALIAVVPLLFTAIPQPERKAQTALIKPSVWADVKEGFAYIVGWRGLVALIGVSIVLNFVLTPAFSLLPLLVSEHFKAGAGGLGIIEGAWGVGMIAGGLLMGVWGGSSRKIITSLGGMVALGTGALMVGSASPSGFWLAVGGVVWTGLMMPVVNGPIFAILQAYIPPDMQGRVLGILRTLIQSVTPVGLLLFGLIADGTSVQVPFILAGLATCGLGIVGLLIPPLVNIEENAREWQQESVSD